VYLFDTDTLSFLLRPRPDEALRNRFAQTPLSERCTSAINVAELLYGAQRSPQADRRERLLVTIASLAQQLRILPFDREAAEQYARVRAELERQGSPLAMADLLIAAVALAQGHIVVTGNIAHFARIPDLIVENWITS
jgi:tRNA(fMet)-specific endonuclease VapC